MQTNNSSLTKLEIKRFSYVNGVFILSFLLLGFISSKRESVKRELVLAKEEFLTTNSSNLVIEDTQCFQDSLKVEIHRVKTKAKKQGSKTPMDKILTNYLAK
jgi:hypothetical protein